jgi:hypothetical protein
MRRRDLSIGDVVYLRDSPNRLMKVEVLMIDKKIFVCGVNTRKRYALKSAAKLVHPLEYVISASDLIQ